MVNVEKRGIQRRGLALNQCKGLISPTERSNHLGTLAFEQEPDYLTNPVVILDDEDTAALQR